MLQNLHTHSTFCDGIHTPEQMVQFALQKGFTSLGFSGHSYLYYSTYANLSPEKTRRYREEINRLKSVYADRLKIYLGLEVDTFSTEELDYYDYLIGSTHYLETTDGYKGFDGNAAHAKNYVDTYFGGDGLAYAKAYYATLATLPQRGKFDIIGHFDLITKHMDTETLFDPESPRYRQYALEAMEALRPHIGLFEVNTGAMARGLRKTPYPLKDLVKELRHMGFGAVISSDCHDGTKLDLGYEDARQLLYDCGFRERYLLTDTGFEATAL